MSGGIGAEEVVAIIFIVAEKEKRLLELSVQCFTLIPCSVMPLELFYFLSFVDCVFVFS